METTCALLIAGTCCLLFSGAIRYTQKVNEILKEDPYKEWHVFLIQLENELKDCRYLACEPQKILLTHPTNNYPVSLEFKAGKLVKVANGGYQPLLMRVKQAHFEPYGQQIRLSITFEQNQKVTGYWRPEER